jgi:germination protein M
VDNHTPSLICRKQSVQLVDNLIMKKRKWIKLLKRSTLFITLILVVAVCCGCSPRQTTPQADLITETVQLYYGDANNEKMVTEERDVSYRSGEDKYTAVLEELLKGPENEDYTANIPADSKVFGTIKQRNDLIVNFSGEFNNFAGSMAEIIGLGSVVNTMTQFEEIERVKILVEGNEYIGPSGEPLGFMGPFPTEPEPPRITSEITLYFGNDQATAVVGEKRVIEIPPDTNRERFIQLVLEELIKGPEKENIYPTIPKEVKVRGVSITDNLVHVDFSEEMHTRHTGGAAGESMTINSIVNTLTEFVYIDWVQLTVAGEPMAIEHVYLDMPLDRNEQMIQR